MKVRKKVLVVSAAIAVPVGLGIAGAVYASADPAMAPTVSTEQSDPHGPGHQGGGDHGPGPGHERPADHHG